MNNENENQDAKSELIPLKDNLFLSPIEKYKIYGRFPWKMVFHILLVIATTAQAILIISKTTEYTRAQERFIYNNFISDSDKTQVDYPRMLYLYSISQLKSHLNNSISNYYNIKDVSLEEVEYLDQIENIFVDMQFAYLDNKNVPSKGPIPREFTYKVNRTSLGPFDYPNEDVKTFLNSVSNLRLNYTFRTYIPFYINHFECFNWVVSQLYSFEHRAHFLVRLNVNRIFCDDRSSLTVIEYFINRLLWIHLIVIFLATMSLILTWRYVFKMANIYWKYKTNRRETKVTEKSVIDKEKKDPNAEQLKSSHRSKLFNVWALICIIGNIVQIFGSGMSLFDTDNIMSSTEILVGFGCMLSYINVGRYLEYNREYSTIFATISRAMPNVLRYLLGVMPIFFGFIFFGLCLFWRSERFVSTSSTMITLFSMLNGDSVFDIFNDLTGVSFFIGQVYCYIFCIMFIVVVMNVFISIIEEAYVSTKMKNHNHWIYSYLKVDPNYVRIKDVDELENKTLADNRVSNEQQRKSIEKMKRLSKEERNLLSNVKSKNILREVFDDQNLKKVDQGVNKNDKQSVEKVLENHFANVLINIYNSILD
jgi:hypothetical protein